MTDSKIGGGNIQEECKTHYNTESMNVVKQTNKHIFIVVCQKRHRSQLWEPLVSTIGEIECQNKEVFGYNSKFKINIQESLEI